MSEEFLCQSEDAFYDFSSCNNEVSNYDCYNVDEEEFHICDDCIDRWKNEKGGICEFCENTIIGQDEQICDRYVCPDCYSELLEELLEEFRSECPAGCGIAEVDTDRWCTHNTEQHEEGAERWDSYYGIYINCDNGIITDIKISDGEIEVTLDNGFEPRWYYIEFPKCPYCGEPPSITKEEWGHSGDYGCEHQIGYSYPEHDDFTSVFPLLDKLREVFEKEEIDVYVDQYSFVDDFDNSLREYLEEEDYYVNLHDCELDGCGDHCNYYGYHYLVPDGWEMVFIEYLGKKDFHNIPDDKEIDIQSLIVVAMLGGA